MADKLIEQDGSFFTLGDDGKPGGRISQRKERLFLVINAPRRIISDELEDRMAFDDPIFTPDDRPRDTTTRIRRRSIVGDISFDDHRPTQFGLIDTTGASPYSGAIRADIHEVEKETVHVWYWSPDDGSYSPGMGLLYVSLYISKSHMDFLWGELQNWPHGRIDIEIVAPLYRHDIDRSFGEPFDLQKVFIRPDQPQVVGNLIAIGVSDPESPTNATEADDDRAQPDPIDSTSAAFRRRILLLLTWIAGCLLFISVLLALRH